MFETASITESYQDRCEDRVAVFSEPARTVIVVADGAGGSGVGAQAAAIVVEEVRRALPSLDSPTQWCNLLRQVDHGIGSGESTAVVVDLRRDSVLGASVGDSQAWVVEGAQIKILTSGQRRKPLLGSGEAEPVGFESEKLGGLLIAATDGFCNYVKREEMVKVIPYEDLVVLPKRLVDMVRLHSGALNDDVGIVVCRAKRRARSNNWASASQPEDVV
jgi:PPM family protein phosphatase